MGAPLPGGTPWPAHAFASWSSVVRFDAPANGLPVGNGALTEPIRLGAFRGTRPTLGGGRDQRKRDINRTSAVHVTFLPITGEPAA